MASGSLCSIIIPAKNESSHIRETLHSIQTLLLQENIPGEILVINDVGDHGDADTRKIVTELQNQKLPIHLHENYSPHHGFGNAIRTGIERSSGEVVFLVMADGSDDPKDIVRFYRKIEEGYDCVFGSRFYPESKIIDYPKNKLFVNRLANRFLSLLFWCSYDDYTNAFKAYKKKLLQEISPLFSEHFNITIELSLKSISRGYRYAVLPNHWYGKKSKISNLRMAKMAKLYLFTALVIWLEKRLLKK